jgi:hypothetical protein
MRPGLMDSDKVIPRVELHVGAADVAQIAARFLFHANLHEVGRRSVPETHAEFLHAPGVAEAQRAGAVCLKDES